MALTEVDAARLNDNVFNATGPYTNRIINGDMRIDQRNAGASVTSNGFSVDRFYVTKVSSTVSYARSTISPVGFTNSLGLTVTTGTATAASDTPIIQHAIEGFNTADLNWGTANAQSVTLSFWVRSSVTGNYGASFRNGSTNRSYVASYTVNAANTWEYKTLTIAGDTSGTWNTDNSAGIYVNFDMGVGSTYSTTAGSWQTGNFFGLSGGVKLHATSGATFYITGVQLEAGSVATPFERRSYATELQLCQRYFETSYPMGTTPGSIFLVAPTTNAANPTFRVWQEFKTTKRASPDMVFYSPDTGASGKLRNAIAQVDITSIADSSSTTGSRVSVDGVTDGNVIRWHYTASSEL